MRISLAVTCVAVAAAVGGVAYADSITSSDQAKAVARAINLTSADMVGWDDSPPAKRTDYSFADPALTRCVRAAPPSDQFAAVPSDGFSKLGGSGVQAVISSVLVWATPGEATSDRTAYFSPRGRGCLKRELVAEVRRDQTSNVTVATVRVLNLRSGVAGVRGMRVQIVLRAGKQRLALLLDIYDFTRGQAEVQLTAIGIPYTFSTSNARRLLKLLKQRAAQQVPKENLSPGAPQGGLS